MKNYKFNDYGLSDGYMTVANGLLLKSLQSLTIEDPEMALQAVLDQKYPIRKEEEILYIFNAIVDKRYSDLLCQNGTFTGSATRNIPDMLWQHICIEQSRNHVKIKFKDFDWFILGCLCFQNEATMYLSESADWNALIPWNKLPDDLDEFITRTKFGDIKNVLLEWTEIPVEHLKSYLTNYLSDPMDKSNPLTYALMERYPTVHASYLELMKSWHNHQKFIEHSGGGAVCAPDFHLSVREMFYHTVFALAQEGGQNIAFAIINDGFIVPMNHYIHLGMNIREAFDQLVYSKPIEIVDCIQNKIQPFKETDAKVIHLPRT